MLMACSPATATRGRDVDGSPLTEVTAMVWVLVALTCATILLAGDAFDGCPSLDLDGDHDIPEDDVALHFAMINAAHV